MKIEEGAIDNTHRLISIILQIIEKSDQIIIIIIMMIIIMIVYLTFLQHKLNYKAGH